ncbi:MAG: hypothetical protein GY739_03450 [Mesoflavibacter sp.]|nr:hypothetical protein [Mesoflavibacter sp.]
MNIDAIESSTYTLKNQQMLCEAENIHKVSSLGHNIYQIKSQLYDVCDVIKDIQHTQNIQINEIHNDRTINNEDEMIVLIMILIFK